MKKEIIQKLAAGDLYNSLVRNNVDYFCGVPDSLNSPFTFFLEENSRKYNVIAANEGNAIGIAIGYHVATGKVPLVYMQNSGLGNALDPLVSLVDQSVLRVPMLLLISWRGQPGTHDEPQHHKQGAITTELLYTLNIPYVKLSPDLETADRQISTAVEDSKNNNKPYALILEKGILEDYHIQTTALQSYELSREEAMKTVVDNLLETEVVIASIGKISRELFQYRDTKNQLHQRDLLVVGGMGHASSIALGVAKQKPNIKVYCLDGDGSVLMHLGSLSTIGSHNVGNLVHVVFNNGKHDSVGGQPTAGLMVDIPSIAKACGYKLTISVADKDSIKDALENARHGYGPALIEIRVHSGARDDLIRPTIAPVKNKESFMRFLAGK